MDPEFSVALSKLVVSKQQVETLEKKVLSNVKDNLVLKQQIQELKDFADGLLSRMPEHWTLEEQNMALKLVLRVIREGLCGEEVLQIIIVH